MACCCNNGGPCTIDNCNVCGFPPLLQLDLEITAPTNLLLLQGPLRPDCVCDEALTYSISTVLSAVNIDNDFFKWMYRSEQFWVNIIGWPCCGLGQNAGAWLPYVQAQGFYKASDPNFDPSYYSSPFYCHTPQPCVKQDMPGGRGGSLFDMFEQISFTSLRTTASGNKCPTGSQTFDYIVLKNQAYGGPYNLGSYTITIL